MGFMDKAKNLAGKHEDKVDEGIDKGGDVVDEHTGDRYTDQIDKGQDELGDQLGTGNVKAGSDAPTGPDQANP